MSYFHLNNLKSKDSVDEEFHSLHFCLLVTLEIGVTWVRRAGKGVVRSVDTGAAAGGRGRGENGTGETAGAKQA